MVGETKPMENAIRAGREKKRGLPRAKEKLQGNNAASESS